MKRVGVIGAGTMGHGIAQVCAMAGYVVRLFDADALAVDRALVTIRANLDKGVDRGKVTSEVRALVQVVGECLPAAGGDVHTHGAAGLFLL